MWKYNVLLIDSHFTYVLSVTWLALHARTPKGHHYKLVENGRFKQTPSTLHGLASGLVVWFGFVSICFSSISLAQICECSFLRLSPCVLQEFTFLIVICYLTVQTINN